MRMLSGRMHWLTVGLALLVSAHGFATKRLHGQALPPGMAGQMPYGMPPGMMQGGVRPAGAMMTPDRPMSMAFEGPPPMDVTYANANGSCDSGPGGAYPGMGCSSCGGAACGGMGCGNGYGGGGYAGNDDGLLSRLGGGGCQACGGAMCGGRGCGGGYGGCSQCGGAGCEACSGAGKHGCLFSGSLLSLLGPCAPYCEGGPGGQRWFDFYAGTIGLARTSHFGGFGTPDRDLVTGAFATSTVVSQNGNTIPLPTAPLTDALSTTQLDLDKIRYGLELIGAIQLGPGTSVEARYFGLNKWNVGRTAQVIPPADPTLYSVYSLFGSAPAGGFDDTDRSFIHSIDYSSELHSGEVNYRRRFATPFAECQASWMVGVRYFDLDERFGFHAVGSNNNTFTFDQLRYFDHDTRTRNELTGFQVGGDYWLNVVCGLQVGVEGKAGVYGNHAEVESQIFSNSIPGAREHLQDGKTAYLGELVVSAVYRLSYSWSVKASYNVLTVQNVALATENFNTRDINNALGQGAFTINRYPFLNADADLYYQGWSIGGEYLW